ncbi:uncharacterized protein LOC117250495 isoform X2 [Epinephelus lanceolatus]
MKLKAEKARPTHRTSVAGSESFYRHQHKEEKHQILSTSDMSLQVCGCCGWSKVTTYHGLRTHQGKMGCTPKGVTVAESEQQFMWGHVELTNNQKDIGLDVYASIKTDAEYYYSDMDLQICHCGWSKVTTHHGLRTHQGKMGCTPKRMRNPKKEHYDWNNQWEKADESKYQPAKRETVKKENVPRSSRTNSHTVSAAITSRVKVEYNSSFSTPQDSSKKATKSRSQLQDFYTLPQYEQWLHEGRRSDWEPPTPAYPETVVQPKKKDRRDQTLSQVADSKARTGYWNTNSYTDPPTAATIKGEPESPILQRSSKKAAKSKSGHQLQDFYTLPQMNTSVREHPTPTYPVQVEERKKKERREQTLSQVADSKARTGYWSTNSYTDPPTAATIKGEPESPILQRSSKKAIKSKSGHQLQDFYTLPQMNTSVREQPTPTYPVQVEERKKKDRREQTLSQENWSINSRKDSATTATIKEEPKSPLAIPQQSSQAAKNPTSSYQLHDFYTGVQVTKLGKERPPIPPKFFKVKIKELPTTTHPATAVRHKEQRREDQMLSQNVPVSWSVNSATATTIKERPKSPFSTPQQPVQRVTNSKAVQQLQESCTGLQVNGSGREVSRTPLATAVQPKEKDRKDRTPSQSVPDSTNSAAAEATTKKDPKSVCETAQSDSSTGLKVKELAQMFSAATTQEAAIQPKKKRRGEQNLSQNVPDSESATTQMNSASAETTTEEDPDIYSAAGMKNVPDSESVTTQMNSASAETTTEEDPDIYSAAGMKNVPDSESVTTQMNSASAETTTEEDPDIYSAAGMKNVPDSESVTTQMNSASAETTTEEDPDIYSAAGMKVKELAQMFSAITTNKTAIQPKGKHKGEQKLSQAKPLAPKVSATTAQVAAVQPKEKDKEDQNLTQNVPVSWSVNSATATTIKERPKSPFSTPQQPVQRVTNSKAVQQLQESCTGLQVNGSGREVSRTPLATAVQPKEKDRKDRTPSQSVPDSTNSAAAEATTKKDPKSVCETAQSDSSTGLKVKELAQMFSAATTQESAVRPKKKRRGEQNLSQVKLLAQELSEATTVRVTAVQPKENGKEDPKLSQNVPDSESVTTQMNSASAETTTEEDPDIYSAAGMKVKELAQMFSAITTNKTAIQPKGKHKGEQNLMQAKPLTPKVSATTAQVAAVQPKEKDKEDQNLTQVRPTDVKHKIQMREPKVDQGSRNWRKCPPLN